MDRNNGGNPRVPPRPPKSIVRVHRPRAPDPLTTMTEPPQLSPKPRHLQGRSIVNNNNNNNNSISNSSRNNNLNESSRTLRTTLPIVNNNNNNISNTSNLSSSRNSRVIPSGPAPTTFTRRRSPHPLPQTTATTTTTASIIQTVSQQVQNSENNNNNSVVVTLAQPRPENERLTNEYVETPFSNNISSSNNNNTHSCGVNNSVRGTQQQSITHHNHHSTVSNQQSNNNNNNRILVSNVSNNHQSEQNLRPSTIPLSSGLKPGSFNTGEINSSSKLDEISSVISPVTHHQTTHTQNPSSVVDHPIVKQPVSFTKGGFNTLASNHSASLTALHHHQIQSLSGDGATNSVICPSCKRCRCEECQRPRQLPSKWICNKTVLCSTETVIDYASCLCCVKALYYHCSKDQEMELEDESMSCADNPCSCAPYKCVSRWTGLSCLSICLPCLLCYWPLRGCGYLFNKCYAKCSRHGCQCSADSNKNVRIFEGLRQEKRLLDSSSDY